MLLTRPIGQPIFQLGLLLHIYIQFITVSGKPSKAQNTPLFQPVSPIKDQVGASPEHFVSIQHLAISPFLEQAKVASQLYSYIYLSFTTCPFNPILISFTILHGPTSMLTEQEVIGPPSLQGTKAHEIPAQLYLISIQFITASG